YNMSPEVRIDTMNDHGDSTPDQYDRAYSGRDEYIEELLSMFHEDWDRSQDPEIVCSPPMDSTDEDQMIDELDPSGSETPPTSGDGSHSPAYDMGWGAAPAAQPDDEGLAYDLGWVSQSPAPAVGMDVGSSGNAQDDDGPTYDLGWGAPSPASEVTADDNEDGQAYDLGWGIGHPDDDPMDNDIIIMKSEVEEKDETAHGVTQSGESSNPTVIAAIDPPLDVIDLTSPEPRRTRCASPTPTENGSPSVDEQLAFRANRRMKAIGSDLSKSTNLAGVIDKTE
ncbi:hypothetical protein P692DRAFT_20746246, partial [Suillus brevipes Sb2]